MNTQSTARQVSHVRLHKVAIVRIVLSMIVIFTLGLSGLLTITFAGWAGTQLSKHPRDHSYILRSTPTQMPTPTLSPSPTGALPPPTGALPLVLSQAVTTLEQQNRLLYGGNGHLPEIALTFDDGPNPYYTPQVLNILEHYKVKATFFCMGRLVAAYPAIVQQEYEAGHVIGDHSWSHPYMPALSAPSVQLQIVPTADIIQTTIGVRPTFFRPPYGAMSVEVLTQASHLGMTTVLWNDEAKDWTRPGVTTIVQVILALAHNGAIILLHDGGGDRSQTVAALPSIIEGLIKSGFQLVTMQQISKDLHK